ncbi:MAG: hypothetical protein AB1696_08915 [Planctomycetota bacterium]
MASIVLVSGMALAAEVRLKNGNLFKGEIIFESDTFVILDIGAGQTTLQKTDIKEIIREDRFVVPPKQEGAKEAPTSQTQPTEATKKPPQKAGASSKMDAKARAEVDRKREDEERKRKEEEEERRWGLTSLEWEAEDIKVHTPGAPAMFTWAGLEETLATVKDGAKPALLYAYNPTHKQDAYYYEKKVFPNPKFERLNLDFLLVLVDSTKEIKNEELKVCMEAIRGKTGVVILNKDLTVSKEGSILGTPLPAQKKFADFIAEALLVFHAAKYKPGSIETFGWTTCEKGFNLMNTEGKPGLLYVYSGQPKTSDERTAAYLIETKLLADERFKGLDAQFVMMRSDSSGADPTVPKNVQGKVGITCWTSDRKKSFSWALKGAEVDFNEFDNVVKRAVEENEMVKYEVGSDSSFDWLDLASGIPKLKTGDRPALIYAYWPEDQKNAYGWEKKVFNQPELKGLPQRFVMIKGNIADLQQTEGGKLRPARKPQCMVMVVAPDLKILASATSPLDLKRFQDMLERAETSLTKGTEKGKGK